MKRWLIPGVSLLAVGLLGAVALFVKADPAAKKDEPADAPKVVVNRVTQVTVYQNNALITREVDVPAGTGTLELIVPNLPPTVVPQSLYSEGADGIAILATRLRSRVIEDDVREEVRKIRALLKERQDVARKIEGDLAALTKNMEMLGKLEDFCANTAKSTTDKGTLNGETVITLAKYVMDNRSEKQKEKVGLEQQLEEVKEKVAFIERQLNEASAGTSRSERDGVIVVDKKNAAAGKVRLNYLAQAAGWRPEYKFKAGKKENEAVQLEYLASVKQMTGEDWKDVSLILSTAQPLLNAAPPDLKMLDVAVVPRGAGPDPMLINNPAAQGQNFKDAQGYRGKAQEELQKKNAMEGNDLINKAAALEQTNEFLWTSRDEVLANRDKKGKPANEGQSVTYHLATKLTVPSRGDAQVLEVTRLTMDPEYFYKAVPILSPHVYRQANLTNKSEYVLLPGEATMYVGTDFVGRMDLPLVAIGEQFTAGFGVDPQLQAVRQMVDKNRTMQGGNQVLKYDYRILISSYKTDAVTLQLWDRLPKAENETVGVTLGKLTPDLSSDPVYLREQRPNNLLRWDFKVEPGVNGEKAKVVSYDFKMELDKTMTIGSFQSK